MLVDVAGELVGAEEKRVAVHNALFEDLCIVAAPLIRIFFQVLRLVRLQKLLDFLGLLLQQLYLVLLE